MYRKLLLLISLIVPAAVMAQQQVDGIIAILDNNIILRSELENQLIYLKSNGEKDDGTLRCRTFEELLSNKLLLSKAQLDSLKVSDDQIESELSRRIENFVQYFGSVAKLEENYRKSLVELKMELRPEIRDLLLVEQQKAKITEDVTVTPKEVKAYFNSIPKDSIPYLPAEVTLNHIVIIPPISEKNKKEAREKLADVRHQILFEKMKFAEMAKYYSQDGSAQQGGYLGEFTRGRMVPEFEEVVFNLKEGEVSEVFETEFGFHIVQLHKRVGETVSASHILVRPRRERADEEPAINRLKEIKAMILTDTISFEKAAARYSEDRESKDCGGCILNPATGENKIPLDALDAEMFFKVDKLKAGEISEPMELIMRDGTKAFHIVKLKARYLPHSANLKDDYQKLHKAALQEKKDEAVEQWFDTARRQVFIEVKYSECANAVKTWNQKE